MPQRDRNNFKFQFNYKKHLFRVLVFPSCNEPGLEIIQSLIKSNKVDVYGGSSGNITYDPSRQILSNHRIYPSLYEKGFKENFIGLIRKQEISFVFPTVDVLVAEFASWNEKGVTFITPGQDVARLVMSKSEIYQRLKKIIPIPEVVKRNPPFPSKGGIRRASLPCFPLFAKSDIGSGAKESFIVNNGEDLMRASSLGYLITEYLPGEEYTVDALSDLSGKLLYSNIRIRGKIGRSISLGTQTVVDRKISGYMDKIARTLKITGPWFAQFKRDSNGIAKLMEINCRMGGSSALTRLSGVNIPLLSVFIYAGYPVKVPKVKRSVILNRALINWCDMPPIRHVIWDLDDTLIRKDDKPDPDSIAYLYDFANRGIKQYLVSRKPEIPKLLRQYSIPDIFVETVSSMDKGKVISGFIKKYRMYMSHVAIINDSAIENLGLIKLFPDTHVLAPDSLAVLGREKVA